MVCDDRTALRKQLTPANVNAACGPNGVTALHVAARWGRADIVEQLLLAGAAKAQRVGGMTLTHTAAPPKACADLPEWPDALLGVPVSREEQARCRAIRSE